MTTFKTTESPYKSDNTASNQCGVTLMNNQVGAVVAEVMKTKHNVSVRYLPSMIRVDAIGRMDFVYDEISEALGEEPGFFDSAEFEENMSTHYGRMIHEDDRTIMFANPEDAAEYLGFDLTASAARPGVQRFRIGPREEEPCTKRTARSTSLSIAICTTGTPPRTTGSRAPSSTPRAGSSASTPTRGWARPRPTGRSSTSRSTPRTT